MRVLLILIIALSACKPVTQPTFKTDPKKELQPKFDLIIDPLLQTYVDAFEAEYGLRVVSNVTFKELGSNLAGQCRFSSSSRDVYVDKGFYALFKDNYTVMEQLMFHEFGHCIMFLKHDNSLLDSGAPASIMHYRTFMEYGDNPDYYKTQLRDLFEMSRK